MHRIILGGVAIVAATLGYCSLSDAADMPVKVLPTLPAPLSGSGFSIGINGGAGFTGQEYDFVTLPGVATSTVGTGKIYPAGAMAGITIGFGGNLGSLYAALETEWDYDFSRFSTPCVMGTCSSKNTWFLAQKVVIGATMPTLAGALPARTTALPPPSQWPIPVALPANFSQANIMPAAVLGIAEHNISACVSDAMADALCGSRWVAGLLVGAQLRFAVAAHWTAKIEYDYIAFRHAFTPAGPGAGIFPATFKELDEQRLTFGVDYHL